MARRKKDAEPEQIGPIGDDERREILQGIVDLKTVLDDKTAARREANGEYRAALKAAKAKGIDPDTITRALKEMVLSAEERGRFYAEYVRNLALMGVPVGFQLDLFAGKQPDAQTEANTRTQSDNGAGTDGAVRTAKAQGYQACQHGLMIDVNNPYSDGTPEHMGWRYGFEEALKDDQQDTAQSEPPKPRNLGVGRKGRKSSAPAPAPAAEPEAPTAA